MREQERALVRWTAALQDSQANNKQLQADKELLAVSLADWHAHLCNLLDSASSELALSLQVSRQGLDLVKDAGMQRSGPPPTMQCCEIAQIGFSHSDDVYTTMWP